jgi:hypothetical protein
MWLEGLGQLKNPMTSLGIEPAAFCLVAWCLNQLRYRTPQCDGGCKEEATAEKPMMVFCILLGSR